MSCGTVVEAESIVSDLTFANSMATGYFLNSSKFGGQGAIMSGGKLFFRLANSYKWEICRQELILGCENDKIGEVL